MNEISVYKTSAEALTERRRLLGLLKLFVAMVCLLVATAYDPFSVKVWALTAVALVLLWRLNLGRWLEAYAGRELRLQVSALEEHRQGFTRLILFEQVEELRVRQGKNERILAIELHTQQGAFIIRGYENMENLFGFLSRHKPSTVIIELEEAAIDWHSPMTWAAMVLCIGLGALLFLLLAGFI